MAKINANISIETEDAVLTEISKSVLNYLAGRDGRGSGNTIVPSKSSKTSKVKPNDGAKKEAVELLKKGKTVDEVAATTGLRKPVVRAYKAHITMGTYKA